MTKAKQGRRTASASTALVVRKPAPKAKSQPARYRAKTPARQELVLSSEAAAILAGPARPTTERMHEALSAQRQLSDDIDMGDIGLVEVEFSEKENAVLDEGVRDEDVSIKPTGQVYISHIHYTRWLNRAIGRGKWAIVPQAKIIKTERPGRGGEVRSALVQPFVLYVHGKRASQAYGEQEYFEANEDQSYGDAAESVYASALRRCCKRLGIGLELWDKAWINGFLSRHAVKVWCEVGREKRRKMYWRKRTDPPFWNEIRERKQDRPAKRDDYEEPPFDPPDNVDAEEDERLTPPPARRSEPPRRPAPPRAPHHDAKGDEPISEPQRQRLWTIATHAGRTNAEVKAWLATKGIDSSKDIKRKDYEAIVAAIEAPGVLGEAKGREPGEEG